MEAEPHSDWSPSLLRSLFLVFRRALLLHYGSYPVERPLFSVVRYDDGGFSQTYITTTHFIKKQIFTI